MKKFVSHLFILISIMFVIENVATAQGLFVPTFEGEKTLSVHFGIGEEYAAWEYKALPFITDVTQKMTVIGLNWEHNVNYGFYHVRAGYAILGDLEVEASGSTEEFWSDYQNFGFYLCTGYMYIQSLSVDEKDEKGITIFFGCGLDASLLLASGSADNYGGYDKLDVFLHYIKLGFLGTLGMRMPEKGFGAYLDLGFFLHITPISLQM